MNKLHDDKRKEARSDACLYVCIHGQDRARALGILADLSPEGFKLSSQTEMHIGEEYELQIKNPYIAAGDSFEAFTAKALWSGNTQGLTFYTGFTFTSHSDDSKKLFSKLESAFEKASQAVKSIAC